MASDNKLNVYFPLVNLNPQGWISQFITPVLSKTGINRSALSNLFYDPYIFEEGQNCLRKSGFTDIEIIEIMRGRSFSAKDKIIFLNGNFLDKLEVVETLRESTLEEKELITYIKFMSTIKPYQQVFLQPYMKLQYGYRKTKKEDFTWVDFPFKQNFDLNYILSQAKPRSEGCGIIDFNAQHQLNIATHINSTFNINFHFASLQLLTQEMDENGVPTQKNTNTKFPYGFNFVKLASNLRSSLETIRLEYGRKVAPGFENEFPDQALKSIIEKREKKVFLLNKTSHTFAFKENGAVQLGVTYMNFHEEKMGAANNVAVPTPNPRNSQNLDLPLRFGNFIKKYYDLKNETKELEEKIQDIKKRDENETISKVKEEEKNVQIAELSEKLAESNKNLNLIKRSLKPNLTTIFIDQIKAKGQLFGVNFRTKKEGKQFSINTNIFMVSPLKEDDGDFNIIFQYKDKYNVDEFLKEGKIPKKYDDNKKKLEEDLTRTYSRIFNSPYDEKPKDEIKTYGNIMFFPLKALLSAAYDFLDQDEKEEIPYIILGNVLLKTGNNICSVNIGDLLIEVDTFQRWYHDKFFKKDRLDYPFGVFVRDVMNDLVPEALFRNRTGFDDKSPTSAVKEVKYYLLSEPNDKLKLKLYLNNDDEDLKELSSLLSRTPTSNPKPLIYFGQINNQTTQVTSPLFSNLGVSEFNFNEEQDAAKGIPHIKIGADGGFFSRVDFQAQDFTKIRTAMALESLADKASRYFFFYYQIGIESMGTNMFNYDSVVCIPSNPLGIDTEENDVGIAGYYKITGISDRFIGQTNSYTSNSRGDWVFNPKYLNREKQKINKAPVTNMIIRDKLDISVNSPINYVFELLENDVTSIINNQANNLQKTNKKSNAKKEKKPKEPEKMRVDREEKIKSPTISPKK